MAAGQRDDHVAAGDVCLRRVREDGYRGGEEYSGVNDLAELIRAHVR